ncbi:hydrolase [Bacillus lacus]|uniref:Hydrolase n=1 Tax=Metabacillus lacus TaxID=1983721 RepID=A0A7X2IZ27_9BACI|nr:hydrolase [Metabacillus lacus]MRX72436.1 hydrolase [Metabacillus lacus]
MSSEKQTYYVDIGNMRVVEVPVESSTQNFKIFATPEEVSALRDMMSENLSAEKETFVRSHIPYREYHYDPENDHYDLAMKKIYAMIHDLGDEQAKSHVAEMGFVEDPKYTGNPEIDKFR